MNKNRNNTKPFFKSITIKLAQGLGTTKSLLLKVHADETNPHWHESVDKWSEEWCCIIHKGGNTYGVYGPIDPVSGNSLVNDIYVIVFDGGPLFYKEVQRIDDIEIISVDSHLF